MVRFAITNMNCLAFKSIHKIPQTRNTENGKSELFCQIKHLQQICNEDAMIYYLGTSQMLKVQSISLW